MNIPTCKIIKREGEQLTDAKEKLSHGLRAARGGSDGGAEAAEDVDGMPERGGVSSRSPTEEIGL